MNQTKFMELSSRVKNLTGVKFGQLTVLGPMRSGSRSIIWLCRCSCGTEKEFVGSNLKSGSTHSCGCYRKARFKTHGMKKTPEYAVWTLMKQRCYNPNNKQYPDYGARGITVCDKWRNSFTSFIESMGTRPSKKHSIDRIDNDGSYSPDNCRWATRSQQNNNTRQNHYITLDGETHSMSEWATITGLSYTGLRARLRRGWEPSRALTEPMRNIHKKSL